METKIAEKWSQNDKPAVLPYEKIAMSGGEMPDGLTWYDREVFLQLRMLYKQYYDGIIDRDTAKEEKSKILERYEFQKFQDEFAANCALLLMETLEARKEYRKNRTLEAADKILFAIERVMCDYI